MRCLTQCGIRTHCHLQTKWRALQHSADSCNTMGSPVCYKGLSTMLQGSSLLCYSVRLSNVLQSSPLCYKLSTVLQCAFVNVS